jgi:hypothetical protein
MSKTRDRTFSNPSTIVVEFGELTDDQRLFINLHALRAVLNIVSEPDGGHSMVAFWLREADRPLDVYDDIRGWAIGNRLPIIGLVED